MKIFHNYANYYDSIYEKKDYKKEVIFIKKIWKTFCNNNPQKILSLGCGTCKHEKILSDLGYKITGVDKSPNMIRIARERMKRSKTKNKLYCYDITSLNLKEKFDSILILFNVIGYQSNINDLNKLFKTCSNHLKKNGIIIFDAWYKPAITKSGPKIKLIKIVDKNNNKIVRKTIPILHLKQSLLEINFKLEINGGKDRIDEKHLMRFFTIGELEALSKKYSLNLIKSCEPLNLNKKVSDTNWNMWIILKKK